MKVGEIAFAAIDFESAGTGPGLTDEPVQIAVAHLNGGDVAPGFSSYLLPSRSVTWAARAVHGIGDERLVGAPRLVDLWPRVKAAMHGRWIVAHGAATEKRFLRVFPFHGFGPWVDTLVLTRAVYPQLASHALGEAVQALGLQQESELLVPGFRWHDAHCDAVASLVLLRHLIAVAGLAEAPAKTLAQTNLAAYFAARKRRAEASPRLGSPSASADADFP